MGDPVDSTLLALARALGRSNGTSAAAESLCREALAALIGPHAGLLREGATILAQWATSPRPESPLPPVSVELGGYWLEIRGPGARPERIPLFADVLAVLRPFVARITEHRDAAAWRAAGASLQRLAQLGERLAGVVHELANPLQSLIAGAELLGRRSEGEAPGELAALSGRLLRAAMRCRAIVNDVLERAHPGAPVPEVFPVREAIGDALSLDEAAGLSPVPVEVLPGADGVCVRADRRRLAQVVTNLLSNARAAARTIPKVIVATRDEEGRPTVRIAVEDDGPGIPEHLRTEIFRPFFTTKPPGQGTGLGLSISRELVERSQGRLTLEPISAGCRFVVELPRVPPASHPVTPVRSGRTRRTILVVDDDRETLETYRSILSLEGHDVLACHSGEEALACLAQQGVDAIVADLRLTDLPGPRLLEALGRQDPDAVNRLVFATGDVTSPESREFLERAQRPVLAKPFQIAELFQVLDTLLPRPTADLQKPGPGSPH